MVWLRGAVRTPPVSAAARVEAGWLLRRLQRGESLSMPHSRPMPAIGRGCHELRINDSGTKWRIVYRIDEDAIVIARRVPQDHPHNATKRYQRMRQAACQLRRDCRERRMTLMDTAKIRRLQAAGWSVGAAGDFLELTPAEVSYIELRLNLADCFRRLRRQVGLTQTGAAARLGSSQSRVAKMEAAHPSVSLDLMVKALLTLGATPRDIGRAIGKVA